MGINVQIRIIVVEDLSLKLERLIRRTLPKKNLNVVLIRFFTFVENFLLLKKKVIINLLKADYLKLFLVIMFEKVISMEQTLLQFYVKLKGMKSWS